MSVEEGRNIGRDCGRGYWHGGCPWDTLEVSCMRPMRIFLAVISSSCLALTPAVAGQRGQHGTPRPASAQPVKSAAHPTPVAVPERIAANPALVTRLQPLLPPGMTIATAATGFKNQGQFIAALHVAHNLNIPFAQLKAEMTGVEHESLGQAIHELQPTANAKAAAKTAEQQARADLKATKPAKTDTDKDDR